MATRARGRGSGHGIDSAILETRVGSTGTLLETTTPEAGRRKPDVGNLASGTSAIQSRAARTQEGFPRCRTSGEAAGGPGIDFEFRPRCRAASLEDGDAAQVPIDTRSRATAEPIGVSSG